MAVLEAILAATGLLFLLILIGSYFSSDRPEPSLPPEEDLAAPYRDELHTAFRLQTSARDLEQRIWAEAARDAGDSSGMDRRVSDAER